MFIKGSVLFTGVGNRNVLLRFRFASGSGSGYRQYLAVFQKQINCTKSCLFNVRSSLFPRKLASHCLSFYFFITFYVGSGSKAKSYVSCGSDSGSTTLLFTLFSLLAVPLTDLSRTTTLTRFLMMRLKASLAEEQKFVLWNIQHIKGMLGI
jgi:hypothetical protein